MTLPRATLEEAIQWPTGVSVAIGDRVVAVSSFKGVSKGLRGQVSKVSESSFTVTWDGGQKTTHTSTKGLRRGRQQRTFGHGLIRSRRRGVRKSKPKNGNGTGTGTGAGTGTGTGGGGGAGAGTGTGGGTGGNAGGNGGGGNNESIDEITVRTADYGLANIGPGTQVTDEPGPNSRRKGEVWKLHRQKKGLPRKKHMTSEERAQCRWLTYGEIAAMAEEEPGGNEPADTAAAKTLANQMLKSPSTALSFRQLWRHKYIEKNLDTSKAWKLFYWPMTHSGAGGKGYNPNTRIAAAKIMVTAFSKWAKASMKTTVQRADGKKELPVGQISKAEFVRWYSGGGKSGVKEAVDTASIEEALSAGQKAIAKALKVYFKKAGYQVSVKGLALAGARVLVQLKYQSDPYYFADDLVKRMNKAAFAAAPARQGDGASLRVAQFEVIQWAAFLRKEGVKTALPESVDEAAIPMDFETFAAGKGGSVLGFGEPGAHKRARRQTDKQWNRIIKMLAKKDDKLEVKRVELRKQYAELVKDGVLREPTRMERLKRSAAGHPDNPSVQAARRILKKKGVKFETPLDEAKKVKCINCQQMTPKPTYVTSAISPAELTYPGKGTPLCRKCLKRLFTPAQLRKMRAKRDARNKQTMKDLMGEAEQPAPKATAKNTRLRTANAADRKLDMTCAQCVYWNKDTTECTALALKVKAGQLCDLYARFIEKMTPARMKKLVGYFSTPVGKLAVVGDPKKRYSLPVEESLDESEYWIVGDSSEYIRKYQRAGNLMHFTKYREEAAKTTDRSDAVLWTSIAKKLYRRKRFKPTYIIESIDEVGRREWEKAKTARAKATKRGKVNAEGVAIAEITPGKWVNYFKVLKRSVGQVNRVYKSSGMVSIFDRATGKNVRVDLDDITGFVQKGESLDEGVIKVVYAQQYGDWYRLTPKAARKLAAGVKSGKGYDLDELGKALKRKPRSVYGGRDDPRGASAGNARSLVIHPLDYDKADAEDLIDKLNESLDEVLRFTRQQRMDVIDSAIGQYELAGEKIIGGKKHAAFKGDYATKFVMRAVDRKKGRGTAEDRLTRKQLDKLVDMAVKVHETQMKLKRALRRESIDEIAPNPADFREINVYVNRLAKQIDTNPNAAMMSLFKRKKPSIQFPGYYPQRVKRGRENRSVLGNEFIEDQPDIAPPVCLQCRSEGRSSCVCVSSQPVHPYDAAHVGDGPSKPTYAHESVDEAGQKKITFKTAKGKRLRGTTVTMPGFKDLTFILVPSQDRKSKRSREGWSVYEYSTGTPVWINLIFSPKFEPDQPGEADRAVSSAARILKSVGRERINARLDQMKVVNESLDEAIGPMGMGGQRKVTFTTDRGMKLKGTTVSIPGFKDFIFVLVPPHGSKAKHTKGGWGVYDYRLGLPVYVNTFLPNRPDLDKPADAVQMATKRLKAMGSAKLAAAHAKMKAVNEAGLAPIHYSAAFCPQCSSEGRDVCRCWFSAGSTGYDMGESIGEGINDKYLFKAVFMAGGTGSGKSFISAKMFGGIAAKYINSDINFEHLLKKNRLPLKQAVTGKLKDKQQAIRAIAKKLSKKQGAFWLDGMLPVVIDGTGKDVKKIAKQKAELEAMGYDTALVFVNTTLDVALKRNTERERTVMPGIAKSAWESVQKNIGKFQAMFGGTNFVVVDNNKNLDAAEVQNLGVTLQRKAMKLFGSKLRNQTGRAAIAILRKTGGKYLRDLPKDEKLAASVDAVSTLSEAFVDEQNTKFFAMHHLHVPSDLAEAFVDEIFLSHGATPRIYAPGKPATTRFRVAPLIFPGDEPTTLPRKRRKPKASDPLGAFLEGGYVKPTGALLSKLPPLKRKKPKKAMETDMGTDDVADMFVEKAHNGDDNDKPKPTTKDAKKAEKEAFDIDDIQLYYDMQIAGSASREEAEKMTRKQFKIKSLTVNPAGRIAVKGMEKPTPPKAMAPAPPAGGEELPPEEPPEEEPPTPPKGGLPRKKPTESAAIRSARVDDRPPTRTVGGMVGGGTIPRTGGSLWPIRSSLRPRISPLAVERSSIKKPTPGEPLYKAMTT